MKMTCMRSGTTSAVSPESRIAPLRPVQHCRAGEMAAQAVKREAREYVARLAVPELQARIGANNKLPVVRVNEHRTLERPAPCRHHAVVMRMRQRDRLQPAEGADDLDGRVVQQ